MKPCMERPAVIIEVTEPQLKLRECPFCGQEPKIEKDHQAQQYRMLHRCPQIGAVRFDWTSDPMWIVKG